VDGEAVEPKWCQARTLVVLGTAGPTDSLNTRGLNGPQKIKDREANGQNHRIVFSYEGGKYEINPT